MSPKSPPSIESVVPDALRPSRACDCPCHRGADVFHVVECCGSVLGRRRRRESLVPLDVPQAQPSANEMR
jgi:hypothetical protein